MKQKPNNHKFIQGFEITVIHEVGIMSKYILIFFSAKQILWHLIVKESEHLSQWSACIYCIWILNKFDMYRSSAASEEQFTFY